MVTVATHASIKCFSQYSRLIYPNPSPVKLKSSTEQCLTIQLVLSTRHQLFTAVSVDRIQSKGRQILLRNLCKLTVPLGTRRWITIHPPLSVSMSHRTSVLLGFPKELTLLQTSLTSNPPELIIYTRETSYKAAGHLLIDRVSE